MTVVLHGGTVVDPVAAVGDRRRRRYANAVFREVKADDLAAFDWADAGEDGFRIVAELTCGLCGAFQAADSDPSFNKNRPIALTVRLFNAVGWRVDVDGCPVCPDCVTASKSPPPGSRRRSET